MGEGAILTFQKLPQEREDPGASSQAWKAMEMHQGTQEAFNGGSLRRSESRVILMVSLFSKARDQSPSISGMSFTLLECGDLRSLEIPFLEEEMFFALPSLSGNKAPKLDRQISDVALIANEAIDSRLKGNSLEALIWFKAIFGLKINMENSEFIPVGMLDDEEVLALSSDVG
ncbi:hypothetical protein CK203_076807 [Vitis vinifera]|uniref:Uncharacterized protein n=1 Tax=Vitis vinifera TaxID=29760 RepID=A0A438ESP4_VITVI|nr:hypothetical protein CK203_076807 [Vitis vinifera]